MNSDDTIDTAVSDMIARSLHVPVDRVVPGASITDDLIADSLLEMTVVMDLE